MTRIDTVPWLNEPGNTVSMKHPPIGSLKLPSPVTPIGRGGKSLGSETAMLAVGCNSTFVRLVWAATGNFLQPHHNHHLHRQKHLDHNTLVLATLVHWQEGI